MGYGLVSSLGGLVFLYLPNTPLHYRMVYLMACAFAMVACYALGVMSHFVPVLMMPVLAFIAILVTMVCRFYGVGVPGSLFFVMASAIGAYTPVEVEQVPLMVGLLAMGCTRPAWSRSSTAFTPCVCARRSPCRRWPRPTSISWCSTRW